MYLNEKVQTPTAEWPSKYPGNAVLTFYTDNFIFKEI